MIADQTASLMKEIFLEKVGEGDVEKSFRTRVLEAIGAPKYKSWFDTAKFKVQGKEIVIEYFSGFAKTYVGDNYGFIDEMAETLGFKLKHVSPGTLGNMGVS